MRRLAFSAAIAAMILTSPMVVLAAPEPATSASECGTLSVAPPPATYQHVIWIWMENKNYRAIIGKSTAPYINMLAADCGLATNYYAASHPSLPNYLAATSGNTNATTTDCSPKACPDSSPSIFGQLTAAGKTWRAYEESMPSNCYKVAYPSATNPSYVPRHNPPTYYADASKQCGTNDIPMGDQNTGALANDLLAGSLPNFAFVTPNMTDDMHSGTNQVANGDTWLSQWVPLMINSPAYASGTTAIFITWDEGAGPKSTTSNYAGEDCTANLTDVSCHVATLVLTPYTSPGTRSATYFNHYSLLRTTEDLLGLSFLDKANTATSMRTDFGM